MTEPRELSTQIRQKYAHFQRLMTSLMWECLCGQDTPVRGVETLWFYQDEQGSPQKHVLHVPDSQLVEGKPVYNDYAKALYLLKDTGNLNEIKTRLAELASVSQEAKTLAGIPKTSRHLLYPQLFEQVTEVRFWRKQLFDSHVRTREQILYLLENQLEDKLTVTRQKYEHGSGVDPVLEARYTEIETLKGQLEVIRQLEVDTFRERRQYDSVQLHLYDDLGNARQLFVPDVGFILSGSQISLVDMDANPRKRRPYRGGKRLEPLIKLHGIEIFIEEVWQAAKET